jgi:hypothetical protein
MPLSNLDIRPLMTRTGLYRCAYPISLRSYSAYSSDEIRKCAGSHFDPSLIDLALSHIEQRL